jgi:tellurite resistance protein
MSNVTTSPYTDEQIAVWLRGLLTVAWADGNFDEEEQKLIASITQDRIAPKIDLGPIEPISPDELAAAWSENANGAENFLRTAVMVALADGIYTSSEDQLLQQFYQALGQEPIPLKALRHTLYEPETTTPKSDGAAVVDKAPKDVLKPVRVWLDGLEMDDPRVARFLCKMIPPQCPFERDVKLFGQKVVHIPPLCKLNPLYEQLVGLRFRALSYLADDRGEDVSKYC